MRKSTKGSKIFVWTFLGLIALGCFVYPAIMLVNLYQAHLAEKWPSVDGVVITSNVKYNNFSRSTSVTNFSLEFEYRYTVQGKSYTGNRYIMGDVGYNSREINQIAGEHPSNSAIKVYYSPQNPAESIIVPGKISIGNFRWAFFIFLPFDFLILFLGIKILRYRRTQTPQQKANLERMQKLYAENRSRLNSNLPLDNLAYLNTESGGPSSDAIARGEKAYFKLRLILAILFFGALSLIFWATYF